MLKSGRTRSKRWKELRTRPELIDLLHLPAFAGVIPGQVIQKPSIGRGSNRLAERLQDNVMGGVVGKTPFKGFFAHGKERQADFFADQAETNARVGPTIANGLGHRAMVARQSSRRRSA